MGSATAPCFDLCAPSVSVPAPRGSAPSAPGSSESFSSCPVNSAKKVCNQQQVCQSLLISVPSSIFIFVADPDFLQTKSSSTGSHVQHKPLVLPPALVQSFLHLFCFLCVFFFFPVLFHTVSFPLCFSQYFFLPSCLPAWDPTVCLIPVPKPQHHRAVVAVDPVLCLALCLPKVAQALQGITSTSTFTLKGPSFPTCV